MKNKLKIVIMIMKPYLFKYLMAIIIIIISTIFFSLTPHILAGIINNNIYEQKLNIIILACFIYFLLIIISYIMNLISETIFVKCGEGIIQSMRKKLLLSISNANGKFFSELKTGELTSKILSDVEVVQGFIGAKFFSVFSNFLLLVILGFSLYTIDNTLTIIVFVVQPVVILVQKKMGKKINSSAKKTRAGYMEVSAKTSEILYNINGIIFNNSKKYFLELYDEVLSKFKLQSIKMQKLSNYNYFVQSTFSALLTVILIVVGIYKILNDKLAVEELLLFNLYITQLLNAIGALTKTYVQFKPFNVSLDNIVEIINLNQKSLLKESKILFEEGVKFKAVSFNYNEEKILEELSIFFEKSKKIAIVGETGSGKSTIFNLLYGLWEYDKGEITIDDIKIENINVDSLRGNITILPQTPFLYNDSILNNLKLGIEYTEEEVKKVCLISQIDQFISSLEGQFNYMVEENGKNLSGGEKQRLSIARMLLRKTDIYLLDEPTTSIDAIMSRKIEKGVLDYLHDKTVITITHKLESLDLYDYIYVMNKGKIVEKGDYNTLLHNKGYFFEMIAK